VSSYRVSVRMRIMTGSESDASLRNGPRPRSSCLIQRYTSLRGIPRSCPDHLRLLSQSFVSLLRFLSRVVKFVQQFRHVLDEVAIARLDGLLAGGPRARHIA